MFDEKPQNCELEEKDSGVDGRYRLRFIIEFCGQTYFEWRELSAAGTQKERQEAKASNDYKDAFESVLRP